MSFQRKRISCAYSSGIGFPPVGIVAQPIGRSHREAVTQVYHDLAGKELPGGDWPEALHAAMSGNELVFQLSEALAKPKDLHELTAA